MEEFNPLVRDLAVVLCTASVVTLLFQKIRQPVVLGYLIAGVIIGPYTPPHEFLTNAKDIRLLSELGVIFLMFSLGLEFSFHKLKQIGISAAITGFLEVILMVLLGFFVGRMIGWSHYQSIFLGGALAISSTTIIIKTLDELNLKHKHFGESIIGILIAEDLVGILLLVGLSTIVTTHTVFSLAILWAAVQLVVVVGGWFIIGYFLVPPLFRKMMYYASEETLTLISVALCLFLAVVAGSFHYSLASGAFIMGSILAETPLVHRIEHLIAPIKNIFVAVFFVTVGTLMNPVVIFHQWRLVLLICLVTIIGKLIITSSCAFITGQSVGNSIRVGFSMAQIGEFALIIAGMGLALQASNDLLYPVIVAVTVITTFTTPYFIRFSGYVADQADKHIPVRTKHLLRRYSSGLSRTIIESKHHPSQRRAAIRLMFNGVIIGLIFIISEKWLLHDISELVSEPWLAKTLGWFLALILSSPFIWGMLVSLRATLPTLKSPKSVKASLYFSLLLVLLELIILSAAYFDNWIITSALAILVVIYFGLFYRQLDRSYRWFEKQFERNFKSEIAYFTSHKELAHWGLSLTELDVDAHSELAHQTLSKCKLPEKFYVRIVAIYRASKVLLNLRGNRRIMPGDKLILLGNHEHIQELAKEHAINPNSMEHTQLFKNFAVKAILLREGDILIGKTLRAYQLLKKREGFLIGLERHGARRLNPDPDTVLEMGDVLFIVGENKNLESRSE